jgi:uncharacterized membrane protein
MDSKDAALRKSEKERVRLMEELEALRFKLQVAERNLAEMTEAKAASDDALRDERRIFHEEKRSLLQQLREMEETRDDVRSYP